MAVKPWRWAEAAIAAVLLGVMPAGLVQAAPQTVKPHPPATVAPSLTVSDVAAHPAAHLGHLTLSGVAGIVTPHKGFVLLDRSEYQREGLSALSEQEKNRIPVVWSGPAPKVREAVRVDGTLAKTAKGYVFTASRVTPRVTP